MNFLVAEQYPIYFDKTSDYAKHLASADLKDIAAAEKISDRFVGRMMQLAYLSPDVLERLVTQREPAALSLNDLVTVADLPWHEQAEAVFGQEGP